MQGKGNKTQRVIQEHYNFLIMVCGIFSSIGGILHLKHCGVGGDLV